MTIFNVKDFENVHINFRQAILDGTLWIEIGDYLLRYEDGNLYVNGDPYNNGDSELDDLVQAIDEAGRAIRIYTPAFMLESNRERDLGFGRFVISSPENLYIWLNYGYRLVAVFTKEA